MDTCVKQPELLLRPPKGKGKGKSYSQESSSSSGNASKRPRTDNFSRRDELAAVRELVECGAELGIHNSRLLRSLILFAPSSNAVQLAAAVNDTRGKEFEGSTQRWGLLVRTLAQETKIPQEY